MVISVAVWIHPGPGGGPPAFARVKCYTPCTEGFKQTMNWVTNELHFVIACLSQKGV